MPRDASEKSWFYGIFFREVPYMALPSFLATGHSWLVLTCVDLGSPRLSFGLGLPCALSLGPCDAASRYEFGVSCSTFFCTNLTPPGPEFHPPVGGVELSQVRPFGSFLPVDVYAESLARPRSQRSARAVRRIVFHWFPHYFREPRDFPTWSAISLLRQCECIKMMIKRGSLREFYT